MMVTESTDNVLCIEECDGDLWLQDVKQIPSPNCDQRPLGTSIDLLVIHAISLPPNEFGGEFVEQLFTNKLDPTHHPYFAEIQHLRVSAHVFVSRSGAMTQFVPFNKRAWHAGESEFCGREACNDFSIGIELEGTDEMPFTDIQYQRLTQLTASIRERWPWINADHIVGHNDIAPLRKTDPGPCFDWDRYFNAIQV